MVSAIFEPVILVGSTLSRTIVVARHVNSQVSDQWTSRCCAARAIAALFCNRDAHHGSRTQAAFLTCSPTGFHASHRHSHSERAHHAGPELYKSIRARSATRDAHRAVRGHAYVFPPCFTLDDMHAHCAVFVSWLDAPWRRLLFAILAYVLLARSLFCVCMSCRVFANHLAFDGALAHT